MANVFKKNYSPDESFFSNMNNYKSIKDFLKKKKKKKSSMKLLLINLISRGIDFGINESISSIMGEQPGYQESVHGGISDLPLSMYDFEDKDPTRLNHAKDYTDGDISKHKLDKPIVTENTLNGLKREFDISDLEGGFEQNNYYGIQDSGNGAYRDI